MFVMGFHVPSKTSDSENTMLITIVWDGYSGQMNVAV